MCSNAFKASLFGLIALGSSVVSAGELQDAMLDVSGSVGHMLALDAERAMTTESIALLDSRRKLAAMNSGSSSQQSTPSAAAPAPQPDPVPVVAPERPVQMALLGIFGLGDNLQADVDIGGSRVRFQRGRPYPLGSSDFPYRLVAIKVPCVLLSKADKSEVSVCLANAGL